LKLINSAYYGFGQQVTNLVRAIIMLGINTVKNLALSTAVMGNLSTGKDFQGLNMEGFWRHSLCVGVAAKMLARKRGIDGKQTEEYFTAGLLHDIGKIPLNAVLAKEYMLTISAADLERVPLYKSEDKTLGINHCSAGAMIAKAWRLEGPVGETIMNHHNCSAYAGDYKDILFTVAAVNRFASMTEIGFSGDRYPENTESIIWETLGISPNVLEGMEQTVSGEIDKAKIFLKL